MTVCSSELMNCQTFQARARKPSAVSAVPDRPRLVRVNHPFPGIFNVALDEPLDRITG